MPRAPRLRSDQRIAAYITRAGRFRSIDPSSGSSLPPASTVLARFGWAVLVEESLRRAWRRSRQASGSRDGSAASP